MAVVGTDREVLESILDEALAEGLPRPWPLDAPLADAGLDSVAVLTLVAEIEARLGVTLGDQDLLAENFATLAALLATIARRRDGAA